MNCERALELHELYLDVRAGRESESLLEPDSLEALDAHFTSCDSCRGTVELHGVTRRAISGLPLARAPRVQWPVRSGRTMVWPAAAAALVAMSVSALALRLRPERLLPGREHLVGMRRGGDRDLADPASLSRADLLSGAPAWVDGEALTLTWTRDVVVRLAPGTCIRVRDERLELLAGSLGASVRSGTPFEIVTPMAKVRVRGTVFHVHVESRSAPKSNSEREETMSNSLKAVPVAAAVSVFVSLGTVIVYNQFGETEVGTDELARVLEESRPELVRLPEAVEKLRTQITEMNGELARATDGLRAVQTTVEEQGKTIDAAALAARSEDSGGDREGTTPPEVTAEEKMKKIAETFETLSGAGFTVLQSGRLGRLVEAIRDLGEEGAEFVLDQLAADDSNARFLAAAIIENLKDPAYVPALEASALEDESFLVRRMASHALAFLGDPAAGDSLARVVEGEKKDMGVRLNAWFGLANLGRPEAVTSFTRLLNEAGGDVPADFVVDTALKVSAPSLLPALRKAYDHKEVSVATRSRILRTLADAETGEYLRFVREVAEDEASDEILRAAARESLER